MTPDEFLEWAELLPEPLAAVTHRGVVLAVNPAAARLGLAPGPLAAWIATDSHARLESMLRSAARSRGLQPSRLRTRAGSDVSVRCGLMRRSSDEAWLLLRIADDGTARSFVTLTRQIERLASEIQRRRDSERALADERERLSVTISSIGDAVLAVDTEGRVALMNAVAEELTGWTARDAVGRPMHEVFVITNERTGQPAENPVERVLETGLIVGLANHTVLTRRDGSSRPIADSAAPIRSTDDEIVGVVLVFRDVTQQQRIEAELARASKLESLGVLAGGIAHDFNNLLTAIVGNLSLVERRIGDEPRIRERLDAAGRACEQAQNLTRQLLTFAKGGAPVKRATAVEGLLRESAAFALQGSRSRAEFVLEPDLPPIDADPTQIRQVVHNLVLNADQAMPGGGRITVRARREDVGAASALPLIPGPYVRFDVEDGGGGIPEPHLPKLFDPFFTTKPSGSGLGLATVFSIVHRHGGHIRPGNRPEGGARFSLWLPVADGGVEAPEEPARGASAGRGSVLVMDDDPVIRDLARVSLAELGYSATLACDGAEAVELVRAAARSGRFYDVLLMDLTVPGGMGGREAFEQIQAILPDARAIVSSGYSNDPVLADPGRHGFVGVLPKPWRLDDLAAALAAALPNGKVRPG